jgi:hypothetical protein
MPDGRIHEWPSGAIHTWSRSVKLGVAGRIDGPIGGIDETMDSNALRTIYRDDRAVRAICDYLACLIRNPVINTLTYYHNDVVRKRVGDIARRETVEGMQKLVAIGAIRLIEGDVEHETGVDWLVSSVLLGRVATGERAAL